MAKLENLKPGQSLITFLKKVANGKVQMELVSFVDKGNVNVTALFNQSDARFAQNKPRRAWKAGEVSDIAAALSLTDVVVSKLEALKEGETLELNLLNPSVSDNSGKKHQLFVVVREYSETELHARKAAKEEAGQNTRNIDYLLDNSENMAKKNPSTGEHILVNGEMVFAETDFSAGPPTHKFVTETVVEEAKLEATPFSAAPGTL